MRTPRVCVKVVGWTAGEHMRKEKLWTWTNALTALVVTLCCISIGVVITLNFRSLYYFDIEYLDIPGISGYSAGEIRQNYDALIDYNGLFYRGELSFPSLAMSESGRVHFAEVKVIFDALQILAILSTIVSAFCIFVKVKKGEKKFFLLSGIFCVAIPLVVGIFVAIGWETFFVMFHRIVFRNDYWIFDPAYDPVIEILPSAFFMHCAFMIVGLVILFALVLLVFYFLARRRKK